MALHEWLGIAQHVEGALGRVDQLEVCVKQLCDWGAQTGIVRKARKPGTCQDCGHPILAGTLYVVGSQMDYQHGPWAHKRLCMSCAAKYGLPNRFKVRGGSHEVQ